MVDMGIYVNPDNAEFRRALNDDIYIDKSGLISYTNSRIDKASRYICVSRPRRFGKSMAADMLVAYYSRGCDSGILFENLEIAGDELYRAHLNRHTVIRLDVQRFITSRDRLDTFIDNMQRAVIRDLAREFPKLGWIASESSLQTALDEVYAQTGEGFVFIIDEWDCVFRMAQQNQRIQEQYLDFLRGLFKGAVYADLVYMTGILPIKKYGRHSAVNMFEEFSMTDPGGLNAYFGFTEAEVERECLNYSVDYGELRRWYDGYLVGDSHIYNPRSVVGALTRGEFKSYWTGTETYEALKVYIERNFDGLREAVVEMIGGGSVPTDPTTFQNDMTTFYSRDDVLTLLVHLGYLTYDKSSAAVSIPNLEVSQEFIRATKTGSEWKGLAASLDKSVRLLEQTWAMDGAAVAAGIDEIHSETTSMLQYNNENSLACVLYMAYYSAPAWYMKPIREFPSGKGFVDLVYLPKKNTDKPAIVAELKWKKSAESAIDQIKSKDYVQWIEEYVGDILLVGINYDKGTK